jgi:hypothetical protein
MDGTKAGTCERCGERTGDGCVMDAAFMCAECAKETSQFDEAEHPDPEGGAERSTPETDAAWNKEFEDRAFYSNCQSVSQRLERERDAARAAQKGETP